MQADFLDAHERHFNDAERLAKAQRWANADHLYGIAVECGLKRLMLAFGMPFDVDSNDPSKSADRKHANEIWVRFESYRCGHAHGTEYALPENAFADWNVSQRYERQSCFDQVRVLPHQQGAGIVQAMIQKAQRDGLV